MTMAPGLRVVGAHLATLISFGALSSFLALAMQQVVVGHVWHESVEMAHLTSR
jgi:hypothetical protein